MPAARKTTRKAATTVATQESGSEPVVAEPSVVPKKRASRKKVVENKAVVNETPSVVGSLTVDVPKTSETMERVKSKVEMFSKGEHTGLLKNIIERYGARLGSDDPIASRRKAYEEFKTQITENQNGVFLNLTSCSEDLWQACVQCIEQLERQHTDFERLDKERQKEIEEMAKNV
jgi:hypothetical protein